MKEGEVYKKRILDAVLERKLAGTGAVLVEGPKWCGKTTTCEQHARSVIYMTDPVRRDRYLAQAAVDITELMKGDQPRLIDEWQDAPKFWDAIRFDVDHSPGWGHYILTGSAVPPDDKNERSGKKDIVHSGTGRIVRVKMRTMSSWEAGESSGEISLKELFSGEPFKPRRAIGRSLADTAYLICRGGWPQSVIQGGEIALDRAFDYVDAIANSDISRVDGVSRDPARTRNLLKSYARLQGTQSTIPTIRRDMAAGDGRGPDDDTISSYLNALRKIFVIEDSDAWCPALRSKAAIRLSDTRYFSDPSIATAALGLEPEDLMNDIRSYGCFFETMVVRDLRVYADALSGKVSHYLDRNGLECDAVVHLRNGASGLVEIKLGGEALIEEGAKTLNALSSLIDTSRQKEVAFKMVVTASGDFAYQRPDGIIVCPLSAMRP
jgi:predicted AAA+ superfamily ATPase